MNRRDFLAISAAGAIGAALLPADAMGGPSLAGLEPEPAPEAYRVGEHTVQFRHPSGRLETISWFGSLGGVVRFGDLPIVYHHVAPMSVDQYLASCEDGDASP